MEKHLQNYHGEEKNKISARKKALEKIKIQLKDFQSNLSNTF